MEDVVVVSITMAVSLAVDDGVVLVVGTAGVVVVLVLLVLFGI